MKYYIGKKLREHHKKIVILLLLLFFLQTVISSWNETLTFDAPCTIGVSYRLLKTGDYITRFMIEHPLGTWYFIGLPILFIDENYQGDVLAESCSDAGLDIIYSSANPKFSMMLIKLPIILLFVLMGFFIFRWAKEIYGVESGLLSLFLFSFSPTMIGHVRLLTTDAVFTVFAFLTIYYFWKFMKITNIKNFILWTSFSSLAFIAKVSSIVILPSLFFLVLLIVYRNKLKVKGFLYVKGFKKKWKNDTLNLSLYFLFWFLIILVVIPASYLFKSLSMSEILLEPQKVSYPEGLKELTEGYIDPSTVDYVLEEVRTPWNTYIFTMVVSGFLRGRYGQDAFLAGKYSFQGWWYYFIVVFLIKTTLPIIILLFLRFFQFVYNKKRFDDYFLLIPLFFFFVTFLFSNINVGIRHILHIYPLIFVFVGGVMLLSKNKYFKMVLLLLLIWHLVSSLLIFPFHVAYFNEIVGPGNGYKYLVDGNLDWGQDLGRLGTYLEENDISHVNLAYFGKVDPSYYGINYTLLPPFDNMQDQKCTKVRGNIAISATHLSGVYLENHSCYDWLRQYEPVKKIGYSIFVYNVAE